MDLNIHIQGDPDDKDTVHLFITRKGLPENLLSRRELRSLARILLEEIDLLAAVNPGSDASLEIQDTDDPTVPCPLPFSPSYEF